MLNDLNSFLSEFILLGTLYDSHTIRLKLSTVGVLCLDLSQKFFIDCVHLWLKFIDLNF